MINPVLVNMCGVSTHHKNIVSRHFNRSVLEIKKKKLKQWNVGRNP